MIGDQRYVNFENFQNAFVTLLRASTGEDWHKIMYDYARTDDWNCTSSSCGNYANILYFILFVIMQQYIMLNLFILVLMQNFEENYINVDNPIQAFENNSMNFKDHWAIFCQSGNIMYIKHNFLIDFYVQLNKPIGLGFNASELRPEIVDQIRIDKKKLAALALMKMNLQSNKEGQMYFNHVFFGFYKQIYLRSE